MSTRFTNNRSSSPTSRASQTRARQTQRSQERVSGAARRVITPTQTRRVVSRGGQFGTPIHRQAGTRNARRQFYVAMDQQGAELRLPAIHLVNPGWRLLSGLIAIAVLVGIYSLWNSPFFHIISVDVSGLTRINADEMTNQLGLIDSPLIEVDREQIIADLQSAYPELSDVSVKIDLPNYVGISATERQPVLAWQQGDQVTWLDAEGAMFPPRGDAGALPTVHSEAAPPVTQIILPDAEETAETSGAEETAAQPEPAPTSAQPKADVLVIQAAQALREKLPAETLLVYHPQNGLGWTDPQGSQIFIGKDLQQFDVKYSMYEKIAAHLAEQGLQPVMISVEYVNAPFYRLEQ